MYNKTFALRLTYIIVLVGLTLCYIFGGVIEFWRNWTSGLAYGLAVSGIMFTFDKRRKRKVTNNSIFWRRIFYLFIIIVLTICYITGDVIKSWGDWFSGLAYAFAVNGLIETFNRTQNK